MGYRTRETREPLVSTRGAESRESPRYLAWRVGWGGGMLRPEGMVDQCEQRPGPSGRAELGWREGSVLGSKNGVGDRLGNVLSWV